MANIKLMVKIPESIWVAIQNREYCGILDNRIYNAIKNGAPLPKEHGRLIDADALPLNDIDDANYGSNYIRIAPTIIEADKAESEE